jgi:hypothetical protein
MTDTASPPVTGKRLRKIGIVLRRLESVGIVITHLIITPVVNDQQGAFNSPIDVNRNSGEYNALLPSPS